MPESGGLFVIDAETGDTSQFNSTTVESGNTFEASAVAKNNGSYGFRIVSGGTADEAFGTKLFADQNIIYTRAYVYIASGFDIGVQYRDHTIMELYNATFYMIARFGPYSQTTTAPDRWEVSGTDITAWRSATNFSFDAWHRLEIKVDLSDGTNCVVEAWVDGTSIGTSTKAITNANYALVDEVRIGPTPAAEDAATGTIYVDDIKAATSPVGAYSAGGLSIPVAMAHYRRRRM